MIEAGSNSVDCACVTEYFLITLRSTCSGVHVFGGRA